jgi:hypothetical protein
MRVDTETKILRFKVEPAFCHYFPVIPSEAEDRAAETSREMDGRPEVEPNGSERIKPSTPLRALS